MVAWTRPESDTSDQSGAFGFFAEISSGSSGRVCDFLSACLVASMTVGVKKVDKILALTPPARLDREREVADRKDEEDPDHEGVEGPSRYGWLFLTLPFRVAPVGVRQGHEPSHTGNALR